jgi:hypothetical protein
MKRTVLSIISAFAFLSANAQCVPSPGFSGNGIAFMPTQLDPVFTCVGCGDHEVVISLQTFGDTTLSVELSPGNPPLDVTVLADFFRLDSIGGLPVGLTYTTNSAFDTTYDAVTDPFGYWINSGDTTIGFTPVPGCISISGPESAWNAAVSGGPNNDGLYPLTIFIDARAANFEPAAIADVVGYNTWLTDMGFLLDAFGDPNFTPNGIKFEGKTLDVRASGVGINDVSLTELNALNNYPNPFSNVTTISFEAMEAGTNFGLMVTDLLGKTVHSQQIQTVKGSNQLVFEKGELPSGVYFYSLSNGQRSITQKMVIE